MDLQVVHVAAARHKDADHEFAPGGPLSTMVVVVVVVVYRCTQTQYR
jgi:hypothetical protein